MIEAATANVMAPKVKKFPPSSVQPIGHNIEMLAVSVPADWEFSDVMKPVAWVFEAPKFAADPYTSRPAKLGCIIVASGPKFMAWLRVQSITLDAQKNPAGLALLCIGPSYNPVTGKACPVDANTGEPWVR